MSNIREGTCGAPGPYDYHCTDYIGHRYACYDAGEDVSFVEGDFDIPHQCDDPNCESK